MSWFVLAQIFTLVLGLVALLGKSDHDKDVEILLLRQQLRILERRQAQLPRLARWEKLGLAILTARLPGQSCCCG